MALFGRRRKKPEDDIIEGEVEDIGAENSPEEDSALSASEKPTEKPKRARWFRREGRPQVRPERVAPDIPTPEEMALAAYEERAADDLPPPRQAPAAWRRAFSLGQDIQPGPALLALSLISTGIFWTLHNRGQAPDFLTAWWPLGLIVLAALWALYALRYGQMAAFLGSNVLAGLGFSLWLDAQDLLPWQDTLAGAVLISLGLGLIARGLVLRRSPLSPQRPGL
jgi:hypothetical protein